MVKINFNKPVKFDFFSWSIMTNVNIYFIVVWDILVKRFLHPISVCVCGIFPYLQAILNCLRIQLNSSTVSWREHQIPQVKGSVPQDSHTYIQMPVTNSACYLYFWPTSYRSEVPMASFLEFRCQAQVWMLTCTSDQLAIN